ncbi:MAG: nucleotidyltransferase domain-containing protein [Spirochaetaceae bacterium]|nr:MAG: nucleotidyltransferase domain-containing protein [Spirochaetaceae bacterium]
MYAQYGSRSIKLFGSRTRGNAPADSDIDFIIDVEKPHRFDLLRLIAPEQELSGTSIDELDRYVRWFNDKRMTNRRKRAPQSA